MRLGVRSLASAQLLHTTCVLIGWGLCVFVYVCVRAFVSACSPACMPACLHVRLSVCLSACLPACLARCLSICLRQICTSIQAKIPLLACLAAYLPTYPSTQNLQSRGIVSLLLGVRAFWKFEASKSKTVENRGRVPLRCCALVLSPSLGALHVCMCPKSSSKLKPCNSPKPERPPSS